MADREFDFILFGATGYTGGLIAGQLAKAIAASPLRWALAGRDKSKVEHVRQGLGLTDAVAVIEANIADPASLRAMASRARVVISAVGPYLVYGEPVVAACIAEDTDYVDLCGEPLWMARMIEAHGAAAKNSNARILFSGGFDSVPFDLGVVLVQEEALKRYGKPATGVHVRVREASGGASGGTAASAMVNIKAAMEDPAVGKLMGDPFALTEAFEGPSQPRDDQHYEDSRIGQWVAPFFMAPINSKNVHRTNYLLGHRYGAEMFYNEMMAVGPGEQGRAIAEAIAGGNNADMLRDAPAPGGGPNEAERNAGGYDLLFLGEMADGQTVRLVVSGRGDPGYSTTSRIITQVALLLAEQPKGSPAGGIWTPGSALGPVLAERLQKHAEVNFSFE